MQTMHSRKERDLPRSDVPAPPLGSSAPDTPTKNSAEQASHQAPPPAPEEGTGRHAEEALERPAVREEEHQRAGSLHIPGSSTTYVVLGLILMVSGVLALIMPHPLTGWFFHAKHYSTLYEEMWRILAATLLSASSSMYALKVASENRMLGDPTVQRMQLGLMWFALVSVVLTLVHVFVFKSVTFWGMLLAAIVMAPTFLLPGVHIGISKGYTVMMAADSFKSATRNVFAPRRVTLVVLCYSILLVVSSLVGLACVFLPKLSLAWTFGSHNVTTSMVFLWQWIGAGMLFLFPSMFYICLERGIEYSLWTLIPKVVNVGIFLASLFNILEFGSLIASEGVSGRWMLPLLLGYWVLALLTSVLGLSSNNEQARNMFEYEVLPSV